MFLRREIDFGKSFRIGPDRKSVGVVLFSRGFLARNPRFLQCPTGPFYALNAETLAENPLPRKCLRPKMSIAPKLVTRNS
jgi:hypothetical protein